MFKDTRTSNMLLRPPPSHSRGHPPMEPRLSSLALLYTVVAVQCIVQVAGFACEASGYCSLGKTKPFVGQVDSGDGLRAALEARSYKREVILMSTDSQRMVPALQAISNFRRLGMEHVMMMSSDGPECMRVAGHAPVVGCVWLEYRLPVFGADAAWVATAVPMWHNRYRIAARAVRLQYNVFILDTDTVVFDDPYKFFKAPPFKDYHMINQPEVLYDPSEYADVHSPNGGVLYIQNIAPDGPVAWIMHEVIDRTVRWADDKYNLTRNVHGITTWCNTMDQDGLMEAITSAAVGRPMFAYAFEACVTDEKRAREGELVSQRVDKINDYINWGERVKVASEKLPPTMHAAAGGETTSMRWIDLAMPNTKGEWPAFLGPNLYPPRGKMSLEWLEQLKQDCPSSPMWPDPEDASQASAAAAIPHEKYLLAPLWLLGNWFSRGRYGHWSRAFVATPQQVVAHVHYIPGTDMSVSKNVVKMVMGHYDWSVARYMQGPRVYNYFQGLEGDALVEEARSGRGAAAAQGALEATGAGGSGGPSFITYHPSLTMGRLVAWEEYTAMLRALAQAALLSGRIPIWPDVPCNVTWIAHNGMSDLKEPPISLRQEWMFYGRTRRSLMCLWFLLIQEPCLYKRKGMLAIEWEHYKASRHMQVNWEPTEGNTVLTPDDSLPPLRPKQPWTARMASVPIKQLARALRSERLRHYRVIYIGYPTVTSLDKPSDPDHPQDKDVLELDASEAAAAATSNEGYIPESRAEAELVSAIASARSAYEAMVSECHALNPEYVVQDLKDKPYPLFMPKPTIKQVLASVDVGTARLALSGRVGAMPLGDAAKEVDNESMAVSTVSAEGKTVRDAESLAASSNAGGESGVAATADDAAGRRQQLQLQQQQQQQQEQGQLGSGQVQLPVTFVEEWRAQRRRLHQLGRHRIKRFWE